MNDVFKMVSVRAPYKKEEKQDRNYILYSLENDVPPLFERIMEHSRKEAIEEAKGFIKSDDYIGSSRYLIEAVEKACDKSSVAAARKDIESALNIADLDVFIKSDAGMRMKNGLWDSLCAHLVIPGAYSKNNLLIFDSIRAFHFIESICESDEKSHPPDWNEIKKMKPCVPWQRVPKCFVELTAKATAVPQGISAHAREVHEKVRSLKEAQEDLLAQDRIFRAERIRLAGTASVETSGFVRNPKKLHFVDQSEDQAKEQHKKSAVIRKAVPIEVFKQVVAKPKPWIFTEERKRLKSATRLLLDSMPDTVSEMATAEIIAAMDSEKYKIVADFIRRVPKNILAQVAKMDYVKDMAEWVPVGTGIMDISDIFKIPSPEVGSPAYRGINILGIGDLLIVKEELINYRTGEIAHIENIMSSEKKERIHSRIRENEEIIMTETEIMEESHKDLQTTDRFELQRESQKTVESEMAVDAGISVSVDYGMVSLDAHANFEYSTSTEEIKKTASTLAKEVVDRSINRYSQKVHEQQTRRSLERFEEKNLHSFNNEGGESISGIYRWVDKYYNARLINYGKRLMLEFIVPEPAAFFKYAKDEKGDCRLDITKPEPPLIWGRDLRPDDLDESNYLEFVSAYQVADVEPYPQAKQSVCSAFSETPNPEGRNTVFTQTNKEVIIPDGYMATGQYGCSYVMGEEGTDFFIVIYLAGNPMAEAVVDGLENIVPVSINGWGVAYNINMVVECEVTDKKIREWQLTTYQAIVEAYNRALADYNERLYALQTANGVLIQGNNPAANRRIEKDELKRGALDLLTEDYSRIGLSGDWRENEEFNAMHDDGEHGYPYLDTKEALAEGKIIQFFEQAFEWNNMTYVFYPYFWGRKENWIDQLALSDVDPKFLSFLKAGAARVVVPVTPTYNEVMLNYLYTNVIWDNGEPPTLEDPLYVSIAEELRNSADVPLDGDLSDCSVDSGYPCLVDQWDVKVPTTLMHLNEDDTL